MKIELDNAIIYHGSNLDILPTLPDNSVDSIVTDPPYELGFMGKSWDNSGIAYSVELWTECMRVLKPGGHLLAFSGSRTYHRMVVAIEDAGFEIRDMISWISNKTFPKSMNISKAIDKAAGAEREVIGTWKPTGTARLVGGKNADGIWTNPDNAILKDSVDITASATPEAKQWEGWGTALKPTVEPIVMARKPIQGTVAANVLEWGTGGINIDASRIGTEKITTTNGKGFASSFGGGVNNNGGNSHEGRWPANLVIDTEAANIIDQQSGLLKGGTWNNTAGARHFNNNGQSTGYETKGSDNSIGGASRFFYVARATKADRNEGLEELEAKVMGAKGNGLARTCSTCGAGVIDGCECPDRTFVNPERKNFHPTVKPTSLMEYLIKLVTPPNGTVLDPFTGSGSTGKAALLNGFQFIGIELTDEYLPIIEARLKWANEQVRIAAEEEEKEKENSLF